VIEDKERLCLGCDDEWPADEEFYDGDALVCRACIFEGVKMQRPKKIKTRGYRTPEAERQYQREKYARHRDRYKAGMRRWYEANRDSQNAKRRLKYAAKKQAAYAAQEV
jgi:hypothetical protein